MMIIVYFSPLEKKKTCFQAVKRSESSIQISHMQKLNCKGKHQSCSQKQGCWCRILRSVLRWIPSHLFIWVTLDDLSIQGDSSRRKLALGPHIKSIHVFPSLLPQPLFKPPLYLTWMTVTSDLFSLVLVFLHPIHSSHAVNDLCVCIHTYVNICSMYM